MWMDKNDGGFSTAISCFLVSLFRRFLHESDGVTVPDKKADTGLTDSAMA
jgi:hypothetical protein